MQPPGRRTEQKKAKVLFTPRRAALLSVAPPARERDAMAIATSIDTIATTADLPTLLAELRATRARAQSALVELRQAQRESEARMAQRPGGDTYKRVAGASSLERAAKEAERVIAAADRQLAAISPLAEVKNKPSWTRPR